MRPRDGSEEEELLNELSRYCRYWTDLWSDDSGDIAKRSIPASKIDIASINKILSTEASGVVFSPIHHHSGLYPFRHVWKAPGVLALRIVSKKDLAFLNPDYFQSYELKLPVFKTAAGRPAGRGSGGVHGVGLSGPDRDAGGPEEDHLKVSGSLWHGDGARRRGDPREVTVVWFFGMASHRPMTSSSPATSRMTMTTTTSRRALPHNNGSRGCVPPRRPRLAHHCSLSRCLAPPAADPFRHCCRSFCQRPSPRLQPSTTIVVFLLLPRLCSWADDKIELGEQLLPGQTRASDGGAFVFGFFSPSNSTPETVHRHMVQHHRPPWCGWPTGKLTTAARTATAGIARARGCRLRAAHALSAASAPDARPRHRRRPWKSALGFAMKPTHGGRTDSSYPFPQGTS
uniref:Uncharacterized protein n=1 Tax=Oryza glumipatula TaxID=40148 RepID=A0A0E0BTK2_9ORYZ